MVISPLCFLSRWDSFQIGSVKIFIDYYYVGGGAQPSQIIFGKLEFEVKHLLAKLEKRCKERFDFLAALEDFAPHPMFELFPGNEEDWEKRG